MLGVFIAAFACLTQGATAQTLPMPSQDPFYVAPADLASLAPGTVIRWRTVTSRLSLEGLASPTSYQVLFRSTDATGNPIAAATTLIVPDLPASGPRRLAVENTAYDSLTLNCSPSYQLTTAQGAGADDATMDLLLARGWDLTIPDYEGEQAEWTVGPLEGHIDLDAAKAVENLNMAGLNTQTEVGVIGLSGGAVPTMWADILLKQYAPTLKLVGIAAADLPANILTIMAQLDGAAFYGPLLGVMAGWERAYPQLGLESLLNARGKSEIQNVDNDTLGCGTVEYDATLGRTSQYFNVPSGAALAALPQVQAVFDHGNVDTAPAFAEPAFLWAEIHDELTFIDQSDTAVADQCAKGAIIDYTRDDLGEHILAAKAEPEMIAYLAGRFAGTAAPDNCPDATSVPSGQSSPTATAHYRLAITQSSTAHGRKVRIRFRAYLLNTPGGRVKHALVRIGSHHARTNAEGVASLTIARPKRAERLTARLILDGRTVSRRRIRIS